MTPPKQSPALPPRPTRFNLYINDDGEPGLLVDNVDGHVVLFDHYIALEQANAALSERVRELQESNDAAGAILGLICVYGTLTQGERPVDVPHHASVSAIVTQIERAELAEAEVTRLKAEIAAKWIPVEQELPPIADGRHMSESVIVSYGDGSQDFARLNRKLGEFYWRSGVDWKITRGVTHWRHRPAPPEPDKGGM